MYGLKFGPYPDMELITECKDTWGTLKVQANIHSSEMFQENDQVKYCVHLLTDMIKMYTKWKS